MKQGYLSQYFSGVAFKRLSAVEADADASNQHEFNGVGELRQLLGEPADKEQIDAKLMYLTDRDEEPVSASAQFTWYDARARARRERGIVRWEYRLYFPSTDVSALASAGDLLVIAKRPDGTLLVLVVEQGSTTERQILWLFGIGDLPQPGFSVKAELESDRDKVTFAARVILEHMGVEVEDEAPNYLEEMLRLFAGDFPDTRTFSAYARSTLKDVDCRDDVDGALIAWMEREEVLFRTLERHRLLDSIRQLLAQAPVDTDAFMSTAMSYMQRRKSRAGFALENHLEEAFLRHGITYSRQEVTEGKLKPDFIFPGIECYKDPAFEATRLTMLAAKTTCKDRWRQILNEAARIPNKHLVTLEPSISSGQTDEMQGEGVQLVVPRALHASYTPMQREWLWTLDSFLEEIHRRQG